MDSEQSLSVQPLGDGTWYCLGCDYELTGNTSGRCPECGADVAKTAVRTHPADAHPLRYLKRHWRGLLGLAALGTAALGFLVFIGPSLQKWQYALDCQTDHSLVDLPTSHPQFEASLFAVDFGDGDQLNLIFSLRPKDPASIDPSETIEVRDGAIYFEVDSRVYYLAGRFWWAIDPTQQKTARIGPEGETTEAWESELTIPWNEHLEFYPMQGLAWPVHSLPAPPEKILVRLDLPYTEEDPTTGKLIDGDGVWVIEHDLDAPSEQK
jgi:hypothetical protein